ncbi:LysR family transcriptional regulator [Brachybacterium sp. YJGR34]|uniref:LysR family transcriptional regulator n=1 Tax=Brachybacterium sp. YJGR34 TaxID=2059911 RepID=UPI000E0B8C36|nr:LysR family transcriptional regulator [Brachybacterium sp. YJGR34]
MLDPVKLRVLRSVVETGSIRASAEALGYTPSAISQHLTSLRRETGLELVERSGRGITVTVQARTLAVEAGRALDALSALDRTVEDLRAGRTGTLRLGYAISIASSWVPELAHDVRRRFPDLRLDLVLRDCTSDDLVAEGMDIVVGEGAGAASREDWELQELLEEGYVAIVGAQHPLAGRTTVPLKELAAEAWVTDDPLDSHWFDRIGASCRAAGFTPRVEVNPHDFATVLGFVATGDYVTVQPSVISRDLRADVVAIPLAPPAPRRRLCLQVRRAVARNPAAQHIVSSLHTMAARRAREIPGLVDLSIPPHPTTAG